MKHKFEISLNEVTGKKVVDVYGYVSNEFGDATFKITRLQLDDGTCLDVEGEHDFPCDKQNPVDRTWSTGFCLMVNIYNILFSRSISRSRSFSLRATPAAPVPFRLAEVDSPGSTV